MPIIINDFEIITTPPPAPGGADQPPPAQSQEPPMLRPQDIERIQRRYEQRLERVRAD
jgi:hypothetical protein